MISFLDEITQCYEAISRVMSIVSANTTRGTTSILKHLGNRPRLQVDSGYMGFPNGFAIGSPPGGKIELSAMESGGVELKTAGLDWITFEFELHSDRKGESVVEALFALPVMAPVDIFMRVFASPSKFDDRDMARRLIENGELMVCTFNYTPLPEPNMQKLIMLMPNPPASLRISRLASLVLA